MLLIILFKPKVWFTITCPKFRNFNFFSQILNPEVFCPGDDHTVSRPILWLGPQRRLAKVLIKSHDTLKSIYLLSVRTGHTVIGGGRGKIKFWNIISQFVESTCINDKCLVPYQIRHWNISQKCNGPRFYSDSSRNHTTICSDSFQANAKDNLCNQFLLISNNQFKK